MQADIRNIIKHRPLIYVVEDNNAYRLLLGRILEKRGYFVMMFSNGREALKMAANMNPSLVVSDIQMPGMNGFDLFYGLKRKYPELEVPFLYVSSTNEAGEIETANKLGQMELLGKPVRPDKLLHSVQTVLQAS